MAAIEEKLSCVLFEDEHLLVVNKPAGWNTHAPSPFAGEGIYDWLRHREPRWASLAIIHRLDKDTSGVLVFGKTPLANRELTRQFTERTVRKEYVLMSDRRVSDRVMHASSVLRRAGDKYVSRKVQAEGDLAQTDFEVLKSEGRLSWVRARPVTGRTHQIRVHASDLGFPILGDKLYGGSPAARLMLHSENLSFHHPATGERLLFQAVHRFELEPPMALRQAFIDSALTNAYRMVHGAADQQPGWFVEKLGEYMLTQAEDPLAPAQRQYLSQLNAWEEVPPLGTYHKRLNRQVRRTTPDEVAPEKVDGQNAPETWVVCENSVQYELSLRQGYSFGLFLDQRDNRRRLLTNHIAADFPTWAATPEVEVLNTFAYTCAFSVCAARAGARATSLDVSKKYLEWGRRNFTLNGLAPESHEFVYGDVFDWLKRWGKKGRQWQLVIVDPPTFSRTRECGEFRARSDYGALVKAALAVLARPGVLLASTNAAGWPAEEFVDTVTAAVKAAQGKILRQHFCPAPPDFPITRDEPATFKSIWLQVG